MKPTKDRIRSFTFAHWFFGRCLGLVSFIAILSYWAQADALIGTSGLIPWEKDLANIESFLGSNNLEQSKFNLRPTLLWFSIFANHNLLFILGTISSLALALGFIPGPAALLTWIFYLSLSAVGEPFLSFQWDALLLESLFISLPFLPFVSRHRLKKPELPSKWARILVLLLLAKLMVESGVVKFTFFDTDQSNSWINYTALDFHYWTQPLPHPLSPLVHSLPPWFDSISLNAMYFIEIGLPFCFFLPSYFRRFALFGQVLLQLAILFSGNYGFFNLLTLTLCIPLIDDALIPQRFHPVSENPKSEKSTTRKSIHFIHLTTLYFLFLPAGWNSLLSDLKGNRANTEANEEESWTNEVRKFIQPIRSINSYGLFRVMTKTRPEIILEGSTNGEDWKLYKFKWKPDHAHDPLQFAGPHMPRIDWQMWFEGLKADRYLSQPFSRFLYGRFLEIIANGGGQKECFDLDQLFEKEELRSFQQAPSQQKQIILSNIQNLMNAFLQQSTWFGKLLEACFQSNLTILEQLQSNPFINQPPRFLRISIEHFQFHSHHKTKIQSIWNVNQRTDSQIIIQKK